jgi:hypothetical protein
MPVDHLQSRSEVLATAWKAVNQLYADYKRKSA